MFFILLTFLAAFTIEGLGTLVSVIGLSALFGSNPIIIALAIALDLGKIVVVTFLYKYWKTSGKLMRTYALLAAAVTMTITSAGASGYLSGEFQKAILGTQESSLKVDVLKQQQAKFQDRKKQIDDQIAALPEKTTVNQRLRLMNGFKAEQQSLDAKIAELDAQLPNLQIAQIGVEAKAGPIIYISKAFNIPVEEAVKWVILMIIFVFDPLAVFLIVAGNSLLEQRQLRQAIKPVRDIDDDTAVDPAHIAFAQPNSYSMPTFASHPDNAVLGYMYFNTSDNKIYIFANGGWAALDSVHSQSNLEPVSVTEEISVPAISQEVLPELAPIVEAKVEESVAEPIIDEPVLESPEFIPSLTEQEEIDRDMDYVLKALQAKALEEDAKVEDEVEPPQAIEEPKAEETTAAANFLATVAAEKAAREQVTLSSLGHVKEDPDTVVDAMNSYTPKSHLYR